MFRLFVTFYCITFQSFELCMYEEDPLKACEHVLFSCILFLQASNNHLIVLESQIYDN